MTPELVSVVVPVRNEEKFVGAQLDALAAQTYDRPWELVVVDNGSTDRSVAVVRSFADRLPSLRIVTAAARPGLNYARNSGLDEARGDLLAFCDADDVVDSGWLAALVEAAAAAGLVGGSFEAESLNEARILAWLPPPEPPACAAYSFLPYVSGGNCAVWVSVARELRWNEEFSFGGSDLEFCWRAQLAGHRIAVAPEAVIHRRYVPSPLALGRRYFSYGLALPHLYRRFRDAGMPRSSTGEALATWLWLGVSLPRTMWSGSYRGNWSRQAGVRCGRLVGSLRRRVLYL